MSCWKWPVAMIAALIAAQPALGQVPYFPDLRGPLIRQPTLSPWFGLYRRDSGPLPNYYQFVRPQQQLQRNLQRSSVAIYEQGNAIRALRQEITRSGQRGPTIPTGVGGGFMNYSHYYPGLRSGP